MDTASTVDPDSSPVTDRLWFRVAIFVAAVLGVAAALQFLPVRAYLTDFLSWTQNLGWLGAVALVATYVVTTVALVPGSILTLGAGYTYGVGWGLVIISVASTLAAAVAFLVGRFFARDFVRKKINDFPRITALDRALERESFKVVFLLRLVPVMPYNVLNYVLSISGVTFGRYVLASWIGMLPGTLMYIYFGSLAEKATRLAAGTPTDTIPVWDLPATISHLAAGDFSSGAAQNLFYWVGLVAAVALVAVVTRKGKAELERLTRADEAEGTDDDIPEATRPEIEPDDAHNRELLDQVHPADWPTPATDETYNLVAIGGGTAGLVGAAGAASLGAKSALIESSMLGGDCLNWGCVPSKALLRSARAAHEARTADRFGVEVDGEVSVNFGKVMERMRKIRAKISHHDSAERFDELGVDVFLEHGRFVDEQTIQVGDRRIRFKKALIATGAKPLIPPIDGLEEAGYLTNETIFQLTELPDSLAVVGGGPIGCEMAQAFQRFGADVTLLEMTDGILPREDRDAAGIVAEAMARDGVDIRTNTRAEAVRTAEEEDSTKTVEITDTATGQTDEVAVDAILVAAGRKPNVDGLGLEAAGVDYDPKGGVTVNDRLQTSNRRIFAAGDVCSRYQFTHTADAQARIVLQNALFFGRAKQSNLNVPWATYTDPEVAHVGLTPERAREAGYEVNTVEQPLDDVDRALIEGNDEGFLRVHLKAGSDEILGATFVGEGAGDYISEVTLAMQGELGLGTLADTIHPYPTTAEAAKKAADAYNRTRLTPRLKSLLETWFNWTR